MCLDKKQALEDDVAALSKCSNFFGSGTKCGRNSEAPSLDLNEGQLLHCRWDCQELSSRGSGYVGGTSGTCVTVTPLR